MTNDELLVALGYLRNVMTSVATGGPRIDEVNEEYQKTYSNIVSELSHRHIENPLPYGSLWDWYGRWSSGDMPTYKARRNYTSELFEPLINLVRTGTKAPLPQTGWPRVDRIVGDLRNKLAESTKEEDFQTIGLLCRETLISLAQAVFIPDLHKTSDEVTPSQTDAKRMLEAYILTEFSGSANEELRKHSRAALELAVALQHRRTASFKDAGICVEATTSIVNIIAIVAGKRDPE